MSPRTNDTSFLKQPFFRPTLLSLQAKFQQLASSEEESEESSTSSLHSSHSSPHTSLQVHLDSSLRTLSSSTQVKQESLKLLNILHSLLTSGLPPNPPAHIPPDLSNHKLQLIHRDNIDQTERFDSSLFDEADNEKLVRSQIRCQSVCELVGAENCIRDLPNFVDRLVSVLGASESLIREAAFRLFNFLFDTLSEIPLLPRLWNRVRSAFRDGRFEEQHALIRISMTWIFQYILDSGPPFPTALFDWNGLISADLRVKDTFVQSIILIMFLRDRLIEDQIGRARATSLFLSFERQQQAVYRINAFFHDSRLEDTTYSSPSLLSYCLLISLRFNRDFPHILTTFLTKHPEIDHHTLLRDENLFFLLCHTSLNPSKPHQPPLDLIFERILRTDPLEFLLPYNDLNIVLPPFLLNTGLGGFHALCRRGLHHRLMDSDLVKIGQHLNNSFMLFSTHFFSAIHQLFLYFPPPLVVRFFLPALLSKLAPPYYTGPLKVILIPLLLITTPFGDCNSVKELYRFAGQTNGDNIINSPESFVAYHCESLQWPNIPPGFGSALACSNPRRISDPILHPEHQHLFHETARSVAELVRFMSVYLSVQARELMDGLSLLAYLASEFNPTKAQWFTFGYMSFHMMFKPILSPIPATVSVHLEAVKRLVCQCSVGNKMNMVRFGLLDIVIRAG
ncbi:hypothetical protein BLNAU_19043 [Blattamonas nauphoetae]|uniref:Uncharacterized protein n=1 Tax=Blattamonas nauphoetae TaxID=2049346 RepID=A0ABQ9X530_9EUKA|nr:hypothetical protein BLNAU_19043 [Blattamonas nauphoetae]